MYNIICCVSFFLALVLSWVLGKIKQKDLILRIFSVLLFIYKIYYFIKCNMKGNVYIPVEISTITYYIMPVVLIFKIKKLYSVGSFFGIMAGLGYFAFYIFFGFSVTDDINLYYDLFPGCFSHGYLLISGIHLYKNNKFERKDCVYIWITILAMLCWGLLFYDIQMRGITFIYYIIKPTFLFVFSNMIFNVLILIVYYGVLVTVFGYVVKFFFKVNKKCSSVS